jgi:hypothetical protein
VITMATLRHGSNWNRRIMQEINTPVIPRSQLLNFLHDYLEACFEGREVTVLPKYQDELDKMLW